MRYFLIISFLLFLSGKPGAQNAPVSSMNSVFTSDSSAVILISVKNFNGIGACGFRLIYDSAIASAVNVEQDINLSGNLDFNLSDPGLILIGWYSYPAVSLSDSSVLFKVTFKKMKFGVTPVSFSQVDNDCYFSNSNFQNLNDEPFQDFYLDGLITFTRNAPHIFLPQLKAVAGEEIEIPVTVVNYSDIGKYVLEIDYDTTVLSFISDNDEAEYDNYICTSRPAKILLEAKNIEAGKNLADSSLLFKLIFLYKGGSASLTWNREVCSFFDKPPLYQKLSTEGTEIFFNDGSVSSIAGNIDVPDIHYIKIFPNPCESSFSLDLGNNKLYKAEIYGNGGNIIDAFETEENGFCTHYLPGNMESGIYFIRITKGNSETETHTLIVNR